MVAHWALIIFLLVFGIAQFYAFPNSGIVFGIAAIVAGIALILGV